MRRKCYFYKKRIPVQVLVLLQLLNGPETGKENAF